MTKRSQPLEHLKAAINELIEVLSECSAGQRDEAKDLIKRMIAFESSFAGVSSIATPNVDRNNSAVHSQQQTATNSQRDQPKAVEMLRRTPYYRMGIGEAAAEALRLTGRDLSVPEIWDILSAAGFPCTRKEPHAAISSLLYRRSHRPNTDVISLGRGRWGRVEWYTPEDIEDIKRLRGGTPTRESVSHSQRTREGMERARELGVVLGRETKLTDEVRIEVQRRIANGEDIPGIAKSLNMAESTIRKHYKKEELERLRDLGAANPDPNGSGFN